VPRRKQTRGRDGDELLVNLNVRLSKGLRRRVRLQSVMEGRLLRAFLADALRERLAKG
jgi:hypothetical protein